MNNTPNLSYYQKSILDPSNYNLNVKIPGTWGRKSIAMHRYFTTTVTTSATGDCCFQTSPNYINDLTFATSPMIYTNDAVYSAGNTAVAVPGTALACSALWNLTANTAKQVRLVSAEYKMSSLSPSLSRTGTLYGALLPAVAIGGWAPGVINTTFPTVPSIQTVRYKRASVVNGESISVSYLPSDEDDMGFLAPNSFDNVRHPNGDDVFFPVIIGQGLAASSNVKIEIYVNYEVIPTPGSSLAGLETPGLMHDCVICNEIQQIKRYYDSQLIRIGRAYDVAISSGKPLENNNVSIPMIEYKKYQTVTKNTNNNNKGNDRPKQIQQQPGINTDFDENDWNAKMNPNANKNTLKLEDALYYVKQLEKYAPSIEQLFNNAKGKK